MSRMTPKFFRLGTQENRGGIYSDEEKRQVSRGAGKEGSEFYEHESKGLMEHPYGDIWVRETNMEASSKHLDDIGNLRMTWNSLHKCARACGRRGKYSGTWQGCGWRDEVEPGSSPPLVTPRGLGWR